MSMGRTVYSGRQALLVYPHLRHEVRREFMNEKFTEFTYHERCKYIRQFFAPTQPPSDGAGVRLAG